MNISIKDTHDFTKKQLEYLFLSVEWSSGQYPDRLVTAMRNFETVYSAWDSDRLVGIICAMDDGIMNAYIHYLLIDPEYQGNGIGADLVERVKSHYRDYLRIVLVADDEALGFYGKCGFKPGADSTPVFITVL